MAAEKISAMAALTGANADIATDYVPIIDAGEADADKNKRIPLNELRNALGFSFNPPTTSTFTYTANASSATQAATDDAKKGLSFRKTDAGAGSTERTVFFGKAAPGATPYTITARIIIPSTPPAEFVRGGLSVYNSSSGKLLFLGINNQGGSAAIIVWYMSALGASAASLFSRNTVQYGIVQWFRISFDGTTYTFYISVDDGITWHSVITGLAATYFTADKVGLAIETFGTVTIAPPPTLLVPYFVET